MVVAGSWDHSKDYVCWKRCSSNSCASAMPHLAECVHDWLFRPTHWPGSPKAVGSLIPFQNETYAPECFWESKALSPNKFQWQKIYCPVDGIQCHSQCLCVPFSGGHSCSAAGRERQRLNQFSAVKDRPRPTMCLQGQGFRWRISEQWLQTTLFQCFFRIIKL